MKTLTTNELTQIKQLLADTKATSAGLHSYVFGDVVRLNDNRLGIVMSVSDEVVGVQTTTSEYFAIEVYDPKAQPRISEVLVNRLETLSL